VLHFLCFRSIVIGENVRCIAGDLWHIRRLGDLKGLYSNLGHILDT
jgi:hypothetical protein